MLVCAAVKYKHKVTDEEVVVCGLRHADAMGVRWSLDKGKEFVEVEQGFITHKGEFLNRIDAGNHALACGQLSATTREYKLSKGERELYSEDLY